MANIKIAFIDYDDNETELQLFCNDNKIFIQIEGNGIQDIRLDRPTAIKLSKVLRAEIAKMDMEVSNG